MKTVFDKFCHEINFKKSPAFNDVEITRAQLVSGDLFEIDFDAPAIIPFAEMRPFLKQLSAGFKYKVRFNLKVLSPVYNSPEITNYLNWIIKEYLRNQVLAQMMTKSIVSIDSSGIVNLTFTSATAQQKFTSAEAEILKIMHKFGFKDLVFASGVNQNQDLLAHEKARVLKEASEFQPPRNATTSIGKFPSKKFIKTEIKELYAGHHNKVSISGQVFEVKEMVTKTDMIVFTFSVTDHTEAIYVKAFATRAISIEQYRQIKVHDCIMIDGTLQLDVYSRQQTIIASSIKKGGALANNRHDEADHKRVELAFRTKMSTMDGIASPHDIVMRAKKWGHKAVAIIDADSVQAFPDFHKAAFESGIKALYGTTANLITRISNAIFNPQDRNLSDDEYVVIDLETTGLSPEFNEIIEFGATIVKNNQVLASKQFFIKPTRAIPVQVTKLTSITNEMVQNAVSEQEGMVQIIDFIGTKTLVAHNAIFDYTFLKTKAQKYGLGDITNPIIDTLITSRIVFPHGKRFRLEQVAKKYNVTYDADGAHRADYDAEILATIFTKQLNDLELLRITNQKLLYEYQDSRLYEKTFKYTMTILAKNQEGLKELFSVVSASLTSNFYKHAHVFIEDFADKSNLLLGSGGLTSKLVDLVFTGSKAQIRAEIAKYDYIEVQPPQNFMHKINDDFSWGNLFEMIKFIVHEAKRQHKIVVATGDARYIDPNEKIYHKIYINAKGLGGVRHYLFNYGAPNQAYPDQHFLTTNEMIGQFHFLDDEQLIREIVVDNTNKITNMIDEITITKTKLYTPAMDDVDDKLEHLVYGAAQEKYGDPLPKIVEARIKHEIEPIKKYGFAIIYWISHLLVDKSLKDGYLVGSRGSVGSSFVATMAQITEVNPLDPHYLCEQCRFSEFYVDSPLNSGYDLDDKDCPQCQAPLTKDGQKIPFETFLGFEANKIPDIDLNFSGDYQRTIHNEVKNIFGEEHSFRAGTISTVAEKTAFGYVKAWAEDTHTFLSRAFTDFLVKKVAGTKRTTGQHPGGIIVIPAMMAVEDFTPINYPANDKSSSWKTTHFDFHAIHDNVLKLDLLGHDDPTAIRYLEKLTGVNVKRDIPFYDPKIISLFSSTQELKISPSDIDGETIGVMGIPEFGTTFVRKMLKSAKVSSFGDLISVSGLSHGTNVWSGNAELVIKEHGKTLSEVISCRDNIMTDLIAKGLEASLAFLVMEQVRRGQGIKAAQEKILKAHHVEDWYIESLKKIKYMFPKAHATAYVMMAWRIAWFKLYHPAAYYATFFTTRADVFDVAAVIQGKAVTSKTLRMLKSRKNNRHDEVLTNRERALIPILELANEAFARNIKIGNISLQKSQIKNWIIDERGVLIPPFVAVDSLGEAVASSIVAARADRAFISIEDLQTRTTITATILRKFKKLGILDLLSEKNQLSMFDFLV